MRSANGERRELTLEASKLPGAYTPPDGESSAAPAPAAPNACSPSARFKLSASRRGIAGRGARSGDRIASAADAIALALASVETPRGDALPEAGVRDAALIACIPASSSASGCRGGCGRSAPSTVARRSDRARSSISTRTEPSTSSVAPTGRLSARSESAPLVGRAPAAASPPCHGLPTTSLALSARAARRPDGRRGNLAAVAECAGDLWRSDGLATAVTTSRANGG